MFHVGPDAPRKSIPVALLLTFFFGPLGLFYLSWILGFAGIVITTIVTVATFGIGLLAIWPLWMVFAAVGTYSHNSQVDNWAKARGQHGNPGVRMATPPAPATASVVEKADEG